MASGKAVAQVSIHPSEDGQLRGGMVHGHLAEMPALVVGIDDFNFRQAVFGLSGIDKREPNSDLFHDVSP
jgi:hypothetical protein